MKGGVWGASEDPLYKNSKGIGLQCMFDGQFFKSSLFKEN